MKNPASPKKRGAGFLYLALYCQSAFWNMRAREHNLKNVDVDIPRGKLVVITGLCSGKFSLAYLIISQ
ncbi:hypothetical protein AGMMS49957_07480 [Synergistales bacterium]|nr:hypothetical protein AGMMS49957_07480 [Synergistales bacterium]